MTRYRFLKKIIKLRGLAQFSILFVAPFLIIVAANSIISLLFPNSNLVDLFKDNFFLLVVQYTLSFLVLYLILHYCKQKTSMFHGTHWFIAMGKAFMPAIIGFGTGYIITMLLSLVVMSLDSWTFLQKWFYTSNYGYDIIYEYIKDGDHWKVLIIISIIVVVTPIYEEILFRGFLYDSINKIFRKHKYLDIILVAVIFGIFHIRSLSNFIFAVIVGLVLTYYRKKEKNIITSIWIHCMVNFTGLFTVFVYKYFNTIFKNILS